MKILMVSPYPPARDGIAAYAVQGVARLRAEGHDVTVLSPGPSAAHQHLDLQGPRGTLALAKRVRSYDKVIIQFHPDVFYAVPSTASEWAEESLALAVVFRLARDVEIRVHEIDYRIGRRRGPNGMLARLPWRLATTILVHTEKEREDFAAAFRTSAKRIQVTEHGADFRRHTAMTRADARASLGLPPNDVVFLSIGFIQPHKGFDRAVSAFGRLGQRGSGCRLDVVGSLRTDDPTFASYFERLQSLVDNTPGAYLHEGYVGDELFDRWIVAADVVVLPYRSIWSSGVLERAVLYQRPVIATDVGGLAHQRALRDGVSLVQDDAGLVEAMRNAVHDLTHGQAELPSREITSWLADGAAVDRDTIQAEVRRRGAAQRDGNSVVRSPLGRGVDGDARPIQLSVAVRRLPPLAIPAPKSARPGATMLKRLVRRLTAWELDPVVHQVNALRDATIKALER